MAKKSARIKIGLFCSVCSAYNYVTQKNKITTSDKLKIRKFCNHCNKRTEHKERKKLH